MKGAIASVEIFAHRANEPVTRLSLVVSSPVAIPDAGGFACRVALANLHRAEEIHGRDSVEVLTLALERGRQWLVDLRGKGFVLYRDRAGNEPYLS